MVISGTFIQVVEAFDLVSEILYNNHMHSTPNEPFTFHVMIDHTKAGRVVGSKVINYYYICYIIYYNNISSLL